MQLTKTEIVSKLAAMGIKAKASSSKAQLEEMYAFALREQVKPAPQVDFYQAQNGVKLSMKSAKHAGLI